MGRPRSAEAHSKVVHAAIRLFANQGIDATSMDSIAESSGVSKATIYKHWADKDALALEALSFLHGLNEDFPEFASGDIRKDLIDCLSYAPTHMPELRERIMPHLMSYSARNEAFGRMWRHRVIDRRRTALGKVFKRGVAEGKLVKKLDTDLWTALLFGPVLYRYVFDQVVTGKSLGSQPPVAFIEGVVGAFLKAFGMESRHR
jgi:AcrR family transcriptional regulator